jgi:hypothetical protein
MSYFCHCETERFLSENFFVTSRLIGTPIVGPATAEPLEQLSLQSYHHPHIGAQLSYHPFH